MRKPVRCFGALLAACSLLLATRAPAAASVVDDQGLEANQRATPIVLDALVLRPVGLVLTAVGTVLLVPAAAVVATTRPTDLGKPFQMLVAAPFRYTFIDPLGQH